MNSKSGADQTEAAAGADLGPGGVGQDDTCCSMDTNFGLLEAPEVGPPAATCCSAEAELSRQPAADRPEGRLSATSGGPNEIVIDSDSFQQIEQSAQSIRVKELDSERAAAEPEPEPEPSGQPIDRSPASRAAQESSSRSRVETASEMSDAQPEQQQVAAASGPQQQDRKTAEQQHEQRHEQQHEQQQLAEASKSNDLARFFALIKGKSRRKWPSRAAEQVIKLESGGHFSGHRRNNHLSFDSAARNGTWRAHMNLLMSLVAALEPSARLYEPADGDGFAGPLRGSAAAVPRDN